jgi:hypothetical protein
MNNTPNLFDICQYDFQIVMSYFDGDTKLIYNSLFNQIHIDMNNLEKIKIFCGFFGSEKFLKYISELNNGSIDVKVKCYDDIINSAIMFGNLELIKVLIQKMCECLNISINEINSKKCCSAIPNDCTFSSRYLYEYMVKACIHGQYHIVEYLISLGVPRVAITMGLTFACMKKNTKIVNLLIAHNPAYCDNCGGRVCHYQNYEQHLPPTSIHS